MVITHQTISRLSSNENSDVEPNLDYNEEEAKQTNSDEVPNDSDGVQQGYIKAISKQLQAELSRLTKSKEECWMLNFLKENGWWIRQENARAIAVKLNLRKAPEALYRDVFVWLPDVRWPGAGNEKSEMMPSCPNCLNNSRVAQHCFRDNHFGRLVVSLDTTYYMISRRYICYECQDQTKRKKEQLQRAAADENFIGELEEDEISYTFMPWDNRIMHLYRHGRGELLPAFLTWRAALDKKVMRMLPPLTDGGFRLDRISKMLCELHSLAYDNARLLHEYGIRRRKANPICASSTYESLGDFKDKRKWRGTVPTAGYLDHARKLYHATTKEYLDKSMKQQGADSLHWDVSYKEAKHLCRYRGSSIYHGLVTATNELGQIRIQVS